MHVSSRMRHRTADLKRRYPSSTISDSDAPDGSISSHRQYRERVTSPSDAVTSSAGFTTPISAYAVRRDSG